MLLPVKKMNLKTKQNKTKTEHWGFDWVFFASAVLFPVMKLRALPDSVKNYSSLETPAKDLTMSSITSCSKIDFCLLRLLGLKGKQWLDFYQVHELSRLISPTLYLVFVRYATSL